ncbi:hypothetical protein GCM10011322_07370 [Salinarimonas ramus]|uniref:Uncharacterized protein n=1 Tax=Salinarimonas ramus TaxID=690164 RepID=A0A917V1X2_9HYPH|nr:hypothetical protein GCM10011322_07370 [Salinarimonas ramus]
MVSGPDWASANVETDASARPAITGRRIVFMGNLVELVLERAVTRIDAGGSKRL